MGDFLSALETAFPQRLQTPGELSEKNWLKTPARSQGYLEIEAGEAVKLCQLRETLNFPLHVLGRGSNVLFPGEELRGLVVQLKYRPEAFQVDGEKLLLDASIYLPHAIQIAHLAGLRGLEFAAGVPGTLGGAVKMNAGTKLGEIGGVLEKVQVASPKGLSEISVSSLKMRYRSSELPADSILLSAVLKLEPCPPDEIREAREKTQEYLAYRNRTQPLDQPTLGSTYKNPPGDHAARLIEAAGMKGEAEGGIQVSPKHANFLVNRGGGRAEEALTLMERIEMRVFQEFGIRLEREIHLLGFETPG